MTDNDAASEPLDAPAPPTWFPAWTWSFGGDDPDLTVTPCDDQVTLSDVELDAEDPDIAIANLRGELAVRDAEIAALRSQVKRPGYDPALGGVVGHRGPGRPVVCTPPVKARILEHLRKGQKRAHAAALVGIHPVSLKHAMTQDPCFKEEVQIAEHQAVGSMARSFYRLSKKSAKDAGYWLKVRDPANYAPINERAASPVTENGALKADVINALEAALLGGDAPPAAPSDSEDHDGSLPTSQP
jgi:hypothetical protein